MPPGAQGPSHMAGKRPKAFKSFEILCSTLLQASPFIHSRYQIDVSLDLVLQIDWAHFVKQVHEIDRIDFVGSID